MKTLSFIIPVYNEEKRLKKTFQALQELQLPAGLKLKEVIFVNDGSTDNSQFKIQNSKLKKKYNIKLITYKNNRGKGFAARQGVLAAKADYSLLFDADMSTPLSELKKFMPYIQKNTGIIVGTRKNGKSTVIKHQPFFRELLGRAFTKLTQIVLQTNITDFTCGFKAFSKQARETIFPFCVVNRWGYDAEILFLAKQKAIKTVEVPVQWANDDDSRVSLIQAIPQTLIELFTIHSSHTIKPFLYTLINVRVLYKKA